jgi:hypothetical protein
VGKVNFNIKVKVKYEIAGNVKFFTVGKVNYEIERNAKYQIAEKIKYHLVGNLDQITGDVK